MVAVAFFVGGLIVRRDLLRKGEPPELAWSIVSYGIVGSLLGARLLYVLEQWEGIFAGAGSLPALLLSGGGFVWYGGLLGGAIASVWPIRRADVGWPSAADSASLGLALAYGIGRIGCHLAGDGDWGTPTGLPWGVAYLDGISPWPHGPGMRVHPAPLYEAAASVLIFALLWRLRARLGPAGAIFALYLVLAGTERFLLEFIRTNRPVLLGLTEAQWTSLVLVAAGASWLARHACVASPTTPRPRAREVQGP
jgi:phosphatidylglycerol:prolipoprotein diacylglycerol transferase